MAIEFDVEAALQPSGRTWFERWLSVLVGIAAILAALLATAQVDAGKHEERALQMAARLSVQVFKGTAGGSPRFSFQINSMQNATALAIASTGAEIAVLGMPETADSIQARAEADVKAADRLLAIAQSMGDVPPASSGLDPATRKVVGTEPNDLDAVVAEQIRQMDISDRFGERGNRTLAGLSLVALGAVLIGLAAVLGRTVPGQVVIVAASLALLAAAAWGVSALLV